MTKPHEPWLLSFFHLFLLLSLIFLAASLASFSPLDPSFFSYSLPYNPPTNIGGDVGANLSGFLMFFLGLASYLAIFFPWVILAVHFIKRKKNTHLLALIFATCMTTASACYLLAVFVPNIMLDGISYPSSGMLGIYLSSYLKPLLGNLGSIMLLLFFSCLSFFLLQKKEFMSFLRKRKEQHAPKSL